MGEEQGWGVIQIHMRESTYINYPYKVMLKIRFDVLKIVKGFSESLILF